MIRSSFRFCGAMLAACFLVTPASARPQMTAPATTEGDFVVHNFKFHSGESLPDVRLHYTTLGKPARDAQGRTTNAVLNLACHAKEWVKSRGGRMPFDTRQNRFGCFRLLTA